LLVAFFSSKETAVESELFGISSSNRASEGFYAGFLA